jgi:hypothetical protein
VERERAAELGEGPLDQIVIADRDPARGDDDVGAQGLRERAAQRGGIVGGDAVIESDAPGRFDLRGEHQAVAAHDLPRPRAHAERHELVAGAHDRDHGPPVHDERVVAGRGRERDVAGAEARSGGEHHLALGEVAAPLPRPPPGTHLAEALEIDPQRVALARGVFLRHDDVGAFGQHGTGGDPHRVARRQCVRR